MKIHNFRSLCFLILVVFALVSINPAAAAAVGQAPVASGSLEAIIAKYRQEIPGRMQAENIPGLALAVVDDHEILWAEGFGYTDWDRRTAVTPDTLFSIQSMSKSFTATAAMFAAQDGLVDLDEPITTYLPDFHVNSIFEEHPEQKITLRMLLSHTAGFVHEAPIGGNSDLPGHTFEEHIASISNTWLMSPVGTHYSYSNLGIDLAGYILQVRSGMPFIQYVQKKVLEPLGMTSSTLDIQRIRATPGRAIGHRPGSFRPPVEFLLIPSGGVWTTANDMSRYLQFHINEGVLDGKRLLRQDLAETMYTSPNRAALDEGYALGIGSGSFQGTRCLGHGGGGFGFNSNMTWYPDLKLGMVVLTNAEHENLRVQLVNDVLGSIISSDIPLYHERAVTAPYVPPLYSLLLDGPSPLTDRALSELIASKAMPLDEVHQKQLETYTGSYVATTWGFPSYAYDLKVDNGRLIATSSDQTIIVTEVRPGVFFDPQGKAADFNQPHSDTPNWATYKIDPQRMALQVAFYVLCALAFLSAIFFWPVRALIRRSRRKSEPVNPEVPAKQSPQPGWAASLAALGALFSLFCLTAIALVPHLIDVPWPRPYADLSWWQYALLSLPFISLVIGVVIALLAGLRLRSQPGSRAMPIYYLFVGLLLVGFNLAILL